jgi:hypothetical protein
MGLRKLGNLDLEKDSKKGIGHFENIHLRENATDKSNRPYRNWVDAQKTPLEKMQELLLITITNRVE